MNPRTDPNVRRLRARQRLCRMQLRAAGKLALAGYTPPAGEGVERIWRQYGWQPSGRVLVTTTEIREAA